jgi:DNA-binding beta-propeller fold protein YncE
MNPHCIIRPVYRVLMAAMSTFVVHAVGAKEREAPPLRQVQEIPLPGLQGRLDHFTIDAERKRMIFSALGNNTVQVVDAFAGRQIHQVDGLSQPQGTLYLAEWNKFFVANAADGHLNIYDGTTFAAIERINFGKGSDPDNLRYDAAAKRIYVGYGEGGIAAIDPATNQRIGTDFKFEGHPEGFQLEANGPRIFVNVADTKSIRVIDRKTGKMSEWKLPDGHMDNFPLALDEANHRIFVGTRRPSRVTVYNTDTGAVVASVPCSADSDDLFYDAIRKRVYLIAGGGFVDVIQQKDPDHYESMGSFPTAIGARTGLWYVKRDRLYVAAPPSGGLGARLLVFEAQTD